MLQKLEHPTWVCPCGHSFYVSKVDSCRTALSPLWTLTFCSVLSCTNGDSNRKAFTFQGWQTANRVPGAPYPLLDDHSFQWWLALRNCLGT